MTKTKTSKWQIAKTKDEVLLYLSKKGMQGAGSETIATDLNIFHHVVYSLLLELEKDNHVHNTATASRNTAFETCDTRITNVGLFFIDTSGYKKKYKKNQWIEFPKTYWYLMLLLGIVLGLFSDVLKQRLMGKQKEKIYYIQPSKNMDTIVLRPK